MASLINWFGAQTARSCSPPQARESLDTQRCTLPRSTLAFWPVTIIASVSTNMAPWIRLLPLIASADLVATTTMRSHLQQAQVVIPWSACLHRLADLRLVQAQRTIAVQTYCYHCPTMTRMVLVPSCSPSNSSGPHNLDPFQAPSGTREAPHYRY